MKENWIIEQRNKFDKLSEDGKKRKIEKNHEEGLEINKRLSLLVDPEHIIPGIDLNGINNVREEITTEYRNTPPKKITKEISESVGLWAKTSFAYGLYSNISHEIKKGKIDNYKKLLSLCNGKPIVDLGAGDNTIGYRLSALFKASGYVGIEPHNWKKLSENLLDLKNADMVVSQRKEVADTEPIPYSIIREDALTFLKRLPDKSVGVLSFGTDNFIVNDREYIKAVKNEIKRVLDPHSAILTHNSMFGDRDNGNIYADLNSEELSRESGLEYLTILSSKQEKQ